MKNVFFTSTMAGGLMLATAFMPVTANADGHGDCVSGPLCGGTYPTIPEQTTSFPSFAVQFEGMTHGVGSAQTGIGGSEGVIGEVFATRDSGSSIDFEAFLASDLCVTDCEEGGFNASVRVFENVTTGGYAFNEGGHNTVAAIGGSSNTFTVGSMNITFPTIAE